LAKTTEATGTWQRSLGQFLAEVVSREPDAKFVEISGATLTYRQFQEAARKTASLYQSLGVQPGDRVCLVLPNCPEILFSWFGLSLLGATMVPINTAYKRDELAFILKDSGARVMVAHADFKETATAAAGQVPELTTWVVVGEPDSRNTPDQWNNFESAFAASTALAPEPEISHDAISALVYTSGTTGDPKGVMITHAMFIAAGQGYAHWIQATPEDRFFTCLPYFHANAQYYSTMGALAAGGTLIVAERSSAGRFWRQVCEPKATIVNFIGMMLSVLLKQPLSPQDGDNSVRLFYGTPAFAPEVLANFETRFGVDVMIGFAMTETCYGTIEPPGGERRPFSCGLPREHPHPLFRNEIKIIDAAGATVPPDMAGEIVIRNPAITPGYWGNQEKTRELIRDGWLHSGDMARMDCDGHLYFVDRKKDIIRRRGENISSQEVEAVLKRHPQILDAAVIGVPSELGDDEVKAYIIPVSGAKPDPAEIIGWCAQHLALFKAPRYLEFRESFARTPSLRVRKEELRAEREDLIENCFDRDAEGVHR
jgi:crotonobetaine/carnitine-CoA ligase